MMMFLDISIAEFFWHLVLIEKRSDPLVGPERIQKKRPEIAIISPVNQKEQAILNGLLEDNL